MSDQKYVWYACYGSNLSRDRFLCYILGGTPAGSSEEEKGCRNKALPKADKSVSIPYPLYFALEAGRWSNRGVAFLGLNRDDMEKTLGRMYLITEEQFLEVVSQENNGLKFDINLNDVKKETAKVFRESWYGNIVYLGDEQGFPIFTFTAYWDVQDKTQNAPSPEYAQTIIRGIKETYHMPDQEVANYLQSKPGIKGNITGDALFELVKSVVL
jgi:hypothetical protein